MNLDNSLRPPSPVQTSRPITQAEYNVLEAAVLKDVSDYYQREIAPKKAELEAKQAELQTRKVELQAKAAFLDKEIGQARDMQARGRQGLEIVAQKREAIAQDKQAIAQDKLSIAQDKQAIAQETRDALAEVFSVIFTKKLPSSEQKQRIYAIYVSNLEVSLEKPPEGKSYFKLNSMKSVIKFLDSPENSEIKTCDFRHFRDKISDVDSLAEYLSMPSCKITTVFVKEFISADARASLAKAEAARSGFVVKTFK